MKKYFDQIFFDKSTVYQSRMIGILLIIIGIVFLYNPTDLHLKISASTILIGFLLILNIDEKHVSRTITGRHLITIITLWIFLLFILSSSIEFENFLIIVILGIITLKEVLDNFMSPLLKKRMNVLFYILIILFAMIIGQRIINILSI